MKKLGKIGSGGHGRPCGVGGEATCWSDTGEAGGGIHKPAPSFPPPGEDLSHHLSSPCMACHRALPSQPAVRVLNTTHMLNRLCVFHISLAANEKENTQPFVVLPKEYPVYLWQPFLRHAYFCFQEAPDQKKFSGLLSDCIRHLNHGRAGSPLVPSGAAFSQLTWSVIC